MSEAANSNILIFDRRASLRWRNATLERARLLAR
jgi:hypothetical protein